MRAAALSFRAFPRKVPGACGRGSRRTIDCATSPDRIERRQTMKSKFVKSFTIIAALAALALALPAELVGQQPRYKLIDLGTFGGPNATVNGPGTRDLSNSGIYAGEAETATPDPFAPNCTNGDCLVQ